MGRRQRCRKICREPVFTGFSPECGEPLENVILTIDEFEAIRLIDLEKQTHEQCAGQMEISRSTVSEIYESAREKIADCIVRGHRLIIQGGNYRLCDGFSDMCHKRHCMKQSQNRSDAVKKEKDVVRIAAAYENEKIFQHFGRTGQFKFYDMRKGKIVSSVVVDAEGGGHGVLAGFLSDNNVDVLICGSIGKGARAALAEAGIKLYCGISGDADKAVDELTAAALGADDTAI